MVQCAFEVEVLTPLVIAGANGRQPDLRSEGLRPSSLRGVMRWWFRAALGSLVPSCTELKEVEGRVFGTTAYCSPVRVRTYWLGVAHLERAYLCMNDRSGSTRKGVQREKIQRLSVVPPSKFLLRLEFPERLAPAVLGSLWLLSMCGGVGARSRRGFGSLALSPSSKEFKISQILRDLSLDFIAPSNASLDCLGKFFELNLQSICNALASYAHSPAGEDFPEFYALGHKTASFWLIKPCDRFWPTWDKAMNELRDGVYREYKRRHGLDRIGSFKPRLASPLVLQIKRAPPDRFFGVAIAFDESCNPLCLPRYLDGFKKFMEDLAQQNPRRFEVREVKLP